VILVKRFDQIEHAVLTDVGVRRSHNQDNFAVQLASDDDHWRQRGHLFVVADGMGAHAVGEKASEQAASVIPHTYNKHAQSGAVQALRKSFTEANASIHAFGQANKEFEGTGTTATALLLRPEGAWVAHVGDSRAYRIRGSTIEQLSYDHSLVWEYARIKHLDPDDVEDIPSNVIHRCLGPEPVVKVDIEGPYPLLAGDIFLLCSDGLSGQVTNAEIGAVASVLPPTEACRFLVDLANLRGGPDNITTLIVHIGGTETEKAEVRKQTYHIPRWLSYYPWWAWSLSAGAGLAILAAVLGLKRSADSIPIFLCAAIAILAGLVGLGLRIYRERAVPELDEEIPRPRIHRRAVCRVDSTLVDRLSKALETLRQQAEEKNWEPDWHVFQQHLAEGEALLRKSDLVGAFREYCLAMLPLTRALQKHRNKEESFTPVWDKSR
jgi:serine/threonine protein phosphatase PrpC